MGCSLLIVASVSEATNMSMLSRNIQNFDSSWECLIFGHGVPSHVDFPSRCNVVVLHSTRWAEIINRGSAIIDSYKCDSHMLMLDDVEIDNRHFNVNTLVNYASKHNIDIASPLVNSATHPWMRDCTKKLKFVEIYVTLFKKRAWESFQKLVRSVPGVGWGYDVCLARQYRSAIDCNESVTHTAHRSLVSDSKRAKKELEMITHNCSSYVK